jgi:hypothetical protein
LSSVGQYCRSQRKISTCSHSAKAQVHASWHRLKRDHHQTNECSCVAVWEDVLFVPCFGVEQCVAAGVSTLKECLSVCTTSQLMRSQTAAVPSCKNTCRAWARSSSFSGVPVFRVEPGSRLSWGSRFGFGRRDFDEEQASWGFSRLS